MSTKEEITNFSLEIEKVAIEKNLSYMDAIIHYCENRNLEIELAAKLLSEGLKEKIQIEAQDLNYLPKSTTGKISLWMI